MDFNSITGDVAAFKLHPLNAAVSTDKPSNGAPAATEDQSTNQKINSRTVDAIADNRISAEIKQSLAAGIDNESSKKPVRTMSHVVEVYNLQGKVRTKFMDSNNNVIYQIPTEMVAKMEDQMVKPETSTSIKG